MVFEYKQIIYHLKWSLDELRTESALKMLSLQIVCVYLCVVVVVLGIAHHYIVARQKKHRSTTEYLQ